MSLQRFNWHLPLGIIPNKKHKRKNFTSAGTENILELMTKTNCIFIMQSAPRTTIQTNKQANIHTHSYMKCNNAIIKNVLRK